MNTTLNSLGTLAVLFMLTLSSNQAFAGGHTVGSGGEAFESNTGLHVLDAMEYQHEFVPQELDAYQQVVKIRFDSLATKLPKTATYLTRFLAKIPSPRWFFSSYSLRSVDDRGNSPILLTNFKKQQAAINLGEEILIQEEVWKKLARDEQAFLLVHESLWNAVGRKSVKNAETIRKLTGRLLSKYHYMMTPGELAGDLKGIIANPASPLFKVIESDLEDLGSAPSLPSDRNQDSFLSFCQNNSHVGNRHLLVLMGLYATGNNLIDLNQANCLEIFRYGKNLKTLTLNNEGITSISPLRFFNQLVEIDLKGNQISDLTPLAQMKNLRRLGLSYNKITSVTALNQLTNLRELDLSRNQIETFSALQGPEIERLNLSGNFIGDNFGGFPKLPKLVVLDLSKNQISSLDHLSLANTPGLKELKLGRNTILSIGQINHFKGLVVLDLSENALLSLSGINALSDIDHLNVAGNKISTLLMSDLPPTIGTLDISGNPLTSILEGVGSSGGKLRTLIAKGTKMKSLKFLEGGGFSDLEHLEISDGLFKTIEIPANAGKLTYLECSRCMVDSIVQQAPNIVLTSLVLSQNSLQTLAGLDQFPHLIHLNLSWNQLSNVVGIRSLSYLTYLNFVGNQPLYQAASDEFGDMRNIIGKKLFDLGYLYDLEELVLSRTPGTAGLTACGLGVEYCPLTHIVKPHPNHARKQIALKLTFE